MSRIGAGLTIKGQEFRGTSVSAQLYQNLIHHASKLTLLLKEPPSEERDEQIRIHLKEIRPQMTPATYDHELKVYQTRKAHDPAATMTYELELEMAKRKVSSEVSRTAGQIVEQQQQLAQDDDVSSQKMRKKGV